MNNEKIAQFLYDIDGENSISHRDVGDIDLRPVYNTLGERIELSAEKIQFFKKDSDHFTVKYGKHKNKIKLKKYIRKLLPEYSDFIVDRVGDVFTCFNYTSKDFKILKGNDLLDAYANHLGQKSCMTGTAMSSCIKLWADNPKKVGLLVFKNLARRLIFKFDNGDIGVSIIYAANQESRNILGFYSNRRGWLENGNGYALTLNCSTEQYNSLPYIDDLIASSYSKKDQKIKLLI